MYSDKTLEGEESISGFRMRGRKHQILQIIFHNIMQQIHIEHSKREQQKESEQRFVKIGFHLQDPKEVIC